MSPGVNTLEISMAGRKNTKTDECLMEVRREKVAQLYLSGVNMRQIGLAVGVSHVTIHKDLEFLRKEWVGNALRDFTEAKAQELAKIDRMEDVAWKSFELSQQPLIIGRAAKGTKGDDKPVDPALLPKRAGDDKWLKHVQWCIEMRCKIFGFIKPPETKYEDNRTVNIDFAQFVQGGNVPDPVEDMINAERAKQLPQHEE